MNETFAKQVFHGKNPVGLSFRREESADKPDSVFQVVGLVRNTKYYELREDFRPIAFVSKEQDDDPSQGGSFVLRSNAPLGEFYRAAEQAVTEIHPGLGIEFTVLTKQLKDSLMRDRLMAALAGTFGALAAALAVLGLYGVIAYMVARRRNEIGVRIALGASRSRVGDHVTASRGASVCGTAWCGLCSGCAPRGSFTFWQTCSTIENADSITLVLARVLRSCVGTRRRCTVNVSS